MDASLQRPIDRWFDSYSADHRDHQNQVIHVVCVPLILWSVLAMLWCIPVTGSWFKPGLWAGLAMFAASLFYYRASRALGLGMVAVFAACGASIHLLYQALGARPLFHLALVVFVVAWIGQFIGHKIEGRKPSFFTDLTYLLIGPAWVLAKLYRRAGWRW